jgi:hypothetical protein
MNLFKKGKIMKALITAILMLTASLSFAQEISKDEYFNLLEQNKLSFEKVEPGMTSEYTSIQYSGPNEDSMEECLVHEKRVILSTDHPKKYLVYKKETRLNDCYGHSKGRVKESLVWEKLHKVNIEKLRENKNLTFKKIFLQNEHVIIYGRSGEYLEFETILELGKSQFYDIIEEHSDEFSKKLLRRSYTDPTSIKIDNLEITEYP